MAKLSFREMLGINTGKEWDQIYSDKNPYGYNPLKNIFSNVRSFHLMEDDYPLGETPATAKRPDVCLPGEKRKWGRMNNYKLRYKKWKEDFPSLRVSMTGIAEYGKDGKLKRIRKFPSKWYSKAQWGGNLAAIEENARQYALAFAKLYVPREEKGQAFVDMLEIGNEPWGDVGLDGYQAIARGVIAAFDEYYGKNRRMELGSAAFQAHAPKHVWKDKKCEYPTGDYIAKALTRDICSGLDELTIHPYSFKVGTATLTEHPESSGSEFQHAEDIFSYRKQVGQGKLPISATEYGWDSGTVGETVQAIYLIRNTIKMAGIGFRKLYIYEGLDNPGLTRGLYNSSGLFTVKGKSRIIDKPKVAYKALLQFINLLGDTEYHKCLLENVQAHIHLLADCDGKPSHIVLWQAKAATENNIQDTNWVRVRNIIRKEKLRVTRHFYKLDGNIQLDANLLMSGNAPTYNTEDYLKDDGRMMELRISKVPYVFEIA